MAPTLSRRKFLESVAILAAATKLPFEVVESALAAEPVGTTLDRTIRRAAASGYSTLVAGPGEPHAAHPDNPLGVPTSGGRVLASFVQFTDVHVVDAQSPLRVEWLDRFAHQCSPGNVVSGSYRPQETMTTQVLSAMVRAVNDVQARRIASGERPLDFAVSTGDNTDNQQKNELDWFIGGLDGRAALTPNSGGVAYEGVQHPEWGAPLTMGGDPTYWRPRAGTSDEYKATFGFPSEDAWGFGVDGLLSASTAPFDAPPLSVPWYSTYGNHDGLIQGNMPSNEVFRQWATGSVKVVGPPANFEPCNAFTDPAALFQGPAVPVTADPDRAVLTRREYIAAHVAAGNGHGFTAAHVEAATAYYTVDTVPGLRFIMLDTVNPGGFAEGSIGTTQFEWMKARIAEAADRYVILFSHHGLHALDNPFQNPNPDDPEPEERKLSGEIEAALHDAPNVIAWVAGHTHQNRVTLRTGANGHVFWDIETAAHIDWPCQNRIIDVVDHGDVLALRCTLLDHAGALTRGDIAGSNDPVLKLAGLHRELSVNDPQFDAGTGLGPTEARNVVLALPKPTLAPGAGGGEHGARSGGSLDDPSVLGVTEERGPLPVTGGPGFQVAAGLALAAAGGLHRFRTRVERAQREADASSRPD